MRTPSIMCCLVAAVSITGSALVCTLPNLCCVALTALSVDLGGMALDLLAL